jgi:2-desacetyl-2-hydroxyethyl bacteriochlorophyllide A dehydrogenase
MGRAVALRGPRHVELVEIDDAQPGPEDVAGSTVVTLISPGTELAYFASEELEATQPDGRPFVPGYAAVFRIDELGDEVHGFTAGQLAFCMGSHRSRQCHAAKAILPVPTGLDPAQAVFARLAGVSMTTLVTTTARPPGPVLVLGLGLVGNLAAQVFQAAGYDVTAVDPIEPRVSVAHASGIRDARTAIQAAIPPPRLVLECSGHEEATLQACRLVRQGGEVVLVGVPWRQRSQATAHQLLHEVFHRYVRLRSGWEWELPVRDEPSSSGSILANHDLALQWIAEGKLRVDGLAEDVRPVDAQHAYEALLRQDGALTRCLRWDDGSS